MAKFMYFDFRCTSCDLKFAYLVYPDVKSLPCVKCSAEAKRIVSPVTIDPRMGIDPDNSTMYDKWARVRKQKAEQDAKKAAEHGDD